tara:strand:+ start:333 stop:884 length:552 start_codon:yes stop_codon:yes gene_type:complete
MIIDKSHSKADLIDLINLLELKIVFSHADNKKDIQDKLIELIESDILIKINYYKIETKEGLINFLVKKNPKKILSIKEKNDVMQICKNIINYCKGGYNIDSCEIYNNIKDISDDLDYIKQFGDIPSVRRACKLIKLCSKLGTNDYTPLISPQVQKLLDEKKKVKYIKNNSLKIKREKIVLKFC